VPDGFEPKTELERIYTLRELMVECRKRVPVIMREIDTILDDPDVNPATKLAACTVLMDRGFGKPRQHHVIHEMGEEGPGSNVKIYIPHNERDSLLPALTIDQHGFSQETESFDE
jgi:hypothetical protein